jgi:hypothetical protein
MSINKVVEFVDIKAPRGEVFDLVLNLNRRLQLSPLWGITSIVKIDPDFPQVGSRYQVKVLRNDGPQYYSTVTEYLPPRIFSYHLAVERDTHVKWSLQDIAGGTRLIYEEQFKAKGQGDEDFTNNVRKVVREWLNSLKRYLELREGRLQRLVKWAMDRFYLKLDKRQRKTIVTILFLQAIGLITFVMAAIALGIASLFI